LQSWLNQVYGTLDSADAAPTVQALAMLDELEKVSAQQANEFKQLREGPLAELNRQLRKVGSTQISLNYQLGLEPAQGAEKAEE